MSLLTNETINHILDRRSIRAYKPEAIPADVVETLLTAKSLGLGSCWCGIHGTPDRCAEFGRVFGLPEGVVAYSVIALGYPNEEKPRAEGRLKPEIIHHNNW